MSVLTAISKSSIKATTPTTERFASSTTTKITYLPLMKIEQKEDINAMDANKLLAGVETLNFCLQRNSDRILAFRDEKLQNNNNNSNKEKKVTSDPKPTWTWYGSETNLSYNVRGFEWRDAAWLDGTEPQCLLTGTTLMIDQR